MQYRYSSETVREHIKDCSYRKIWLCPSIVSNGSISVNPLLSGIECTASTVPEALLDKKVRVTFNDGDFHCIIWENN